MKYFKEKKDKIWLAALKVVRRPGSFISTDDLINKVKNDALRKRLEKGEA